MNIRKQLHFKARPAGIVYMNPYIHFAPFGRRFSFNYLIICFQDNLGILKNQEFHPSQRHVKYGLIASVPTTINLNSDQLVSPIQIFYFYRFLSFAKSEWVPRNSRCYQTTFFVDIWSISSSFESSNHHGFHITGQYISRSTQDMNETVSRGLLFFHLYMLLAPSGECDIFNLV